jgi:hypothetical protein
MLSSNAHVASSGSIVCEARSAADAGPPPSPLASHSSRSLPSIGCPGSRRGSLTVDVSERPLARLALVAEALERAVRLPLVGNPERGDQIVHTPQTAALSFNRRTRAA